MNWRTVVLCCLAVLLAAGAANAAVVDYLQEDFSGGAIPDGWTTVDNNSDGYTWAVVNSVGCYTSMSCGSMTYPVAAADSDCNVVNYNDELRTPALDLTNCTGVHLIWVQDFYFLSAGDVAEADYSLNGGSDWTMLGQWTASNLCTPHDYNLTGIVDGQSNVMFRWKYTTTGGWEWWYAIDNVQVTGDCVGVFLTPPSDSQGGDFGDTVSYTLTVTNNTGSSATFDLTYDSNWDISGPATVGPIADGATQDITVDVTIPESKNKYYYSDEATVTVSSQKNGYSDTSTLTTYVSSNWENVSGTTPEPKFWFGSAVHDGKLYVVGGLTGTAKAMATTNKVFSYDPAADAWTELATMPTGLMVPVCDFIGDLLYCAGGGDASFVGSNLLQVYDPAADEWSTDYATLPNPRQGGAGGAVNGKFYYVSGGPDGTFANVSTDVYEYDPDADAWTTKAAFPVATGVLIGAGTPCGDKLYVGGDYRGYNQFYAYDPAGDAWTALENIPLSAGKMSPAMACFNGKVYLWGGDYGYWSGQLTSTWVYEPSKQGWQETPYSLNTAVTGQNGGLLGVTLYSYGGTQGFGALDPAPFEKLLLAYLATLEVTPDSAELDIGDTKQFTATIYEFGHSPVEGLPVTWASSDEDVATVDENGLVTAVAAGESTITASYEDLSGTADVTVNAPADDDTDDDTGDDDTGGGGGGGCGCGF